ncbi:glycoside hydrolase family 2 TIM barrel-domain containing protein [Maribacter thermophilus]|uniref:glycoside hydrolase family 2 TIM barrel-domain containing protein n=1 Tax=Maribacter thermophilus TaxID=1197874 RepID=UPI000A77F32F|nr:glycoside hydrolase family 2 TIM barrel-domain containing protein [Maribacter thermophilus]
MNRNLYRAFLLLTFLVLNGLILYGLSALWSYLNTGADRATMLHLPAQLTANYIPKVIWSPLKNEGRSMEQQTLQELERDYIKAWYVRNNALETNNHYGVQDYYTDSARVKIFDILDFNKENNTYIKTTTVEHHPTLEFYSADGKLAVLTDKNIQIHKEVFVDDIAVLKKASESTFKVMLLLEDGFWRIRHMVEIENEDHENKVESLPLQAFKTDIANSKGLNYYPKDNPWNMFGKRFNDTIIDNDFKKINSIGLNTIRIFVPYETFEKAVIDEEKLGQLKQTMDLAAKNGLKVTVTLFDFYGDYSLSDWTLTHRHAEKIVNALKDHEALLAWDIKNEPDLDFESRGKENVLSWLHQMIFEIRKWDTKNPITIGWSSPEAAIELLKEVDIVSFHYYRKPDDFKEAYTTLKNTVGTKPMVLQEYGYSSYSGLWNGYLGSAQDQADYYKEMQTVIEEENLPFLLWTLYDFEEVPNAVVGRLPWRKSQQKHFGIIDSHGELKPAYHHIIK